MTQVSRGEHSTFILRYRLNELISDLFQNLGLSLIIRFNLLRNCFVFLDQVLSQCKFEQRLISSFLTTHDSFLCKLEYFFYFLFDLIVFFSGTVEKCFLDGLKKRSNVFVRTKKLASLYSKVGQNLPAVAKLIPLIEEAEAKLDK